MVSSLFSCSADHGNPEGLWTNSPRIQGQAAWGCWGPEEDEGTPWGGGGLCPTVPNAWPHWSLVLIAFFLRPESLRWNSTESSSLISTFSFIFHLKSTYWWQICGWRFDPILRSSTFTWGGILLGSFCFIKCNCWMMYCQYTFVLGLMILLSIPYSVEYMYWLSLPPGPVSGSWCNLRNELVGLAFILSIFYFRGVHANHSKFAFHHGKILPLFCSLIHDQLLLSSAAA